ncbi:Oxidoreductase family, NAD-binding Rossmann fold protein [Verrucomicrobiia bacterium DG1235]|nr:Oxidoreductase family, NAD-binding Rossmann fold protein [Verrucomicrobiae bacterium DG1235]
MSDTIKPIRTAIVGFGQSGELSHAYGIRENPEFKILAVCDLSFQRREYAQKSLGCETYSDHRELLQARGDIDLAAVVTRSDTHCVVACELLDAGINVLVTKPWAVGTTEAEAMIRAQERSGKRIFPWVPMYWSPEYTKLKELIGEGSIGKPFTIRRYITQFSKRTDWQTELKYGGGYLNNWGAHIVQPLLGLADSPVAHLSGHLQQVLNGGDGDDNFLTVIQFENGILGIAEYAQAVEGLPSFMIQGTSGTLLSDGQIITLIQKDPERPKSEQRTRYPIIGKRFGDEAEIYHDVAQDLLYGVPFRATTEDSYYGTAILDAIRKSHHTKSFVSNFKLIERKIGTLARALPLT